MRLIDCSYDWHFNLIDPERLPKDMTQLTTPNFEYTRYQPLKRLRCKITGYDSTGDVLTTDDDTITGLLEVGDQIFTDDGRYIGKVDTLADSSGASTITLIGDYVKKNILMSSGYGGQYRGYVYVCGDGALSLSDQEFTDSFYQFTTKGRGGKDSFVDAAINTPLNMLQSMVSSAYTGSATRRLQVPYGTIFAETTITATFSSGATSITPTSTSGLVVGMGITGADIPQNTFITAVGSPAITISNATSGAGTSVTLRVLPIGDGAPNTYDTLLSSAPDSSISESKFLTSFSRNFSALTSEADNLGQSGTLVLPPAFRTFYSARLDIGQVTSNQYLP